jgi:hypothetical protein
MLSCAFGWSDGAKVERLHPMARPLRLPLGFAIRMEDGAGTNRLWPIVPEFAHAVVLRGRFGLRFTGAARGVAIALRLLFGLATLAGSAAIASIAPATVSLSPALAGGAAMGFSADQTLCSSQMPIAAPWNWARPWDRLKEDSSSLDIAPASCPASPGAAAGI